MEDRPSYDDKLLRILEESAAVFSEKGYHSASIRDIAAATGVSLSGLYYYFRSKEELLFLIQDHCFSTLLARLHQELAGESNPACRLRLLVRNHLRFFVENMKEMKVLSHEADVLTGEFRAQVRSHKRRYARILTEILAQLRPDDGPDLRTGTFALFGMMNWIYTWYIPGKDLPVEALEEEIVHLFLHGFQSARLPAGAAEVPERTRSRPASIWRSG